MIELTDDQWRELALTEPPRVHNPRTDVTYVLVRADVYERLQALLDDFRPEMAYPALDRTFAEGWDDPKMADYDHYEERKR